MQSCSVTLHDVLHVTFTCMFMLPNCCYCPQRSDCDAYAFVTSPAVLCLLEISYIPCLYTAVAQLMQLLCHRSAFSSLSVLQETVQHVEANLSDPSQAMRVATLRLLCCFEQPQLASSTTLVPASTSQASQVFLTCLNIQTQAFNADSGRQASVAIGKIRNQLEYKQITSEQVGPAVRCLIGIMHIRSGQLALILMLLTLSPAIQHLKYSCFITVCNTNRTHYSLFLSPGLLTFDLFRV